MGNGKAEGVTPDMIRTASSVIGKMPPEELQRMIKLASSFQGGNPILNRGSMPTDVSPDMLKMASEMMSKMSPEDFQQMSEMASSFKGVDGASSSAASSGYRSDYQSKTRDTQNNAIVSDNASESITSQQFLSSRSFQSSMPSSSTDLQEQMRNQMKDPAMRQVINLFPMEQIVIEINDILFIHLSFPKLVFPEICCLYLKNASYLYLAGFVCLLPGISFMFVYGI